MLTNDEYLLTWAVYGLSVLGLAIVWWRVTRPLAASWWKSFLRLWPVLLLLMPAFVISGNERMAPAILILMLENTIVDVSNPLRVQGPLIFATVLTLILALLWMLLCRLANRKG